MLLFISIVTPYRIAFTTADDITWLTINYVVDFLFAVDLVVTFLSAYEDDNEELIHDKCTIAKAYLKSWFLVDLLSVIPLTEFIETTNSSALSRIARLPKLYRLIRVFKLIRVLKMIKERKTLSRQLNDILKVSDSIERLVFFCFMYLMLVHITSCFWIIIASFEDTDVQNFILHNNLEDLDAGY